MSKYYSVNDVSRAIIGLPNDENGYSGSYDKAEILNALEDLPTIEVSDDCISRERLIEEIARRDTTDGYVKTFGGREVNEIILNAPRVVPIYQPITIKADEKDLEPLKKQLKDIKTPGTLVTEEEYGLFGYRFRTVEHAPSEDNKAYTYCSRCGMRVIVDAPKKG